MHRMVYVKVLCKWEILVLLLAIRDWIHRTGSNVLGKQESCLSHLCFQVPISNRVESKSHSHCGVNGRPSPLGYLSLGVNKWTKPLAMG